MAIETDWFTVELLDDTTYCISEYKHWEETHCYLLIANDKCVLIDTGLGVANIKNIIDKITDLPVEVISTHIHWDHIGGHKYFSKYGVHEKEKDWIIKKFPIPLQVVKDNLRKYPCDFPCDFNIDNYEIFQGKPSFLLSDGEKIQIGEREITVIHTPGHSPGHMCFYEKKRGYLFSGDLIYKGTLDIFYPTTNPTDFMQSVQKISTLDIKRIFPGHHNLDIKVNLVDEINQGFSKIKKEGCLHQGDGVFKFENFEIHI
ncbi:MBL fold metallo-hydrolase [Clostridium sp.]|uniref:MBL fold metallo-hydrolase n=1 Tax=Clostridium sp. TaxID=1506 RepID=UPI00321630BC